MDLRRRSRIWWQRWALPTGVSFLLNLFVLTGFMRLSAQPAPSRERRVQIEFRKDKATETANTPVTPPAPRPSQMVTPPKPVTPRPVKPPKPVVPPPPRPQPRQPQERPKPKPIEMPPPKSVTPPPTQMAKLPTKPILPVPTPEQRPETTAQAVQQAPSPGQPRERQDDGLTGTERAGLPQMGPSGAVRLATGRRASAPGNRAPGTNGLGGAPDYARSPQMAGAVTPSPARTGQQDDGPTFNILPEGQDLLIAATPLAGSYEARRELIVGAPGGGLGYGGGSGLEGDRPSRIANLFLGGGTHDGNGYGDGFGRTTDPRLAGNGYGNGNGMGLLGNMPGAGDAFGRMPGNGIGSPSPWLLTQPDGRDPAVNKGSAGSPGIDGAPGGMSMPGFGGGSRRPGGRAAGSPGGQPGGPGPAMAGNNGSMQQPAPDGPDGAGAPSPGSKANPKYPTNGDGTDQVGDPENGTSPATKNAGIKVYGGSGWALAGPSAGQIGYPREAFDDGAEGTVVLEIALLSNGLKKDVSVKKSSGSAALDEWARRQMWRFTRTKPTPDAMTVTIAVTFRLPR